MLAEPAERACLTQKLVDPCKGYILQCIISATKEVGAAELHKFLASSLSYVCKQLRASTENDGPGYVHPKPFQNTCNTYCKQIRPTEA